MSSGLGGGGRGQSPKRVKADKEDGEYRGTWPDWLEEIVEKFWEWKDDDA